MTAQPAAASGASELRKRVLSGIVMGLAAIGATIAGGWIFAALWTVAALCVAFEWHRISRGGVAAPALMLHLMVVILAAAGAWLMSPYLLGAAVLGGLIAAATAGQGRLTALAGAGYAGGLAAAAILCRSTGFDGAVVIFWLFAVVWGTDTLAYFTGRSLGGPKLWPRVSPKKTWSGALGGLAGGVLLGCLLLASLGVSLRWQHVALSVLFSVLTQAGDLFESALKRRYDVKDSGTLIPGHGGFMDRLDGFIFAVIAAAAVGAGRGGLAGVPAGLIAWN